MEGLQARLAELEIVYSIEELRQLRKLDLMGSPIQDSDLLLVDALPMLEELNLSSTDISNTGLRYLKKTHHQIRRLDFRACKGDGGLSALHDFSQLQVLDLSDCDLDGHSLSHLEGLPLRALFLARSSFRDIYQLSALPKLRDLDLGGLQVDSKDLQALQRLPSLESLALNGAFLPSRFFSMLARYPRLRHLELRNLGDKPWKDWPSEERGTAGKESPELPIGFGKLQSIDLSGNRALPPTILRRLLLLPRLRSLFLADSNLQPASFANLQVLAPCRLQKISLSGLPLKDTDLAFLAPCQRIELLDLSHTKMTGNFLRTLSLKKLRFLDLSSTHILEKNLAYLQASPRLQSLFLNNTKIGAKGLAHIQKLKNIEELELNYTRSGRSVIVLPDALPKLKHLSILENGLDPIEADRLAKNNKNIVIEF